MSSKSISPPMQELEASIYDRKFAYPKSDKVLTWMMGNAMLKSYDTKSYFLTRENRKSKIDGVMACILGIKVWMTEIETAVSVYESRGMRML